jgi:phage-related protein
MHTFAHETHHLDGQQQGRRAGLSSIGATRSGIPALQAATRRSADDWKPMPTIGPGVREIRIREAAGAFRVIYITQVADAVHVLHGFQKKTQKTSLLDIRIAQSRLKLVTR